MSPQHLFKWVKKIEPYFDVLKNDITSVSEGYIDFKHIYDTREMQELSTFLLKKTAKVKENRFKELE